MGEEMAKYIYILTFVLMIVGCEENVSSVDTAASAKFSREPNQTKNFQAFSVGVSSVRLSWEPPADMGKHDDGSSASLRHYAIYWKEGEVVSSDNYDGVQTNEDQQTYTVSGLAKDKIYSFLVVSENTAGLTSTSKIILGSSSQLIRTWEDLQNMETNGEYILANDIIFPRPGTHDFPTEGFVPIGTSDEPFAGVLYGNRKKIVGLYINRPELDFVGIFSIIDISGTVVQDLFIDNPIVSGNAVVGSLVGYLKKGEIKNITVTHSSETARINGLGTLLSENFDSKSPRGYHGGIAGAVGKDGFIISSSNSTTVQGAKDHIGGLAGYNTGTISGFTTGKVEGNGFVGGLVGYNDTDGIVRGYTTGVITANSRVGGLVGYNINDVFGYTSAKISGKDYVGGLVGYNKGKIEGYVTSQIVGNSVLGGLTGHNALGSSAMGFATGSVKGSKNTAGGLVGKNLGVLRGFATNNVFGISEVGGMVGRNEGTILGYANGNIFGNSKLGGLVGSNTLLGVITGYSLAYVKVQDSERKDISPGVGIDSGQAKNIIYVGQTETESQSENKKTGAGDHVSGGEYTGAAPSKIIIENTESKDATSFNDLIFNDGDWNWVMEKDNVWPTLRFPADFPNGMPQQNPKIVPNSAFVE